MCTLCIFFFTKSNYHDGAENFKITTYKIKPFTSVNSIHAFSSGCYVTLNESISELIGLQSTSFNK
jgi:hypothetical protein